MMVLDAVPIEPGRIYELQYHKDVLIDVRHVGEDGIPRGPHGEPKPWGTAETSGDFRIEKLPLSVEEGEAYRAASMAHQHGEPEVDIHDDDSLIDYIVHKTDDDFRARLKGLL